jgi:hypothetical protein
MRLFRGQGGVSSSALFGLRGSKSNVKQSSDDSIGSSISPTDQFDIIVPYKTSPGTWKFIGDQRDDDTEVSSITTDEYRYRRRSPNVSYQASTASSSFCCCSTMPTESITPTDNTLITSRAPPPSDTAAIRDIYEAGDPLNDAPSNALEFMNCCGPTEQPLACPYKRSTQKGEGRTLNRSNSLFDAISDDEDQESPNGAGIKRFGKTLRRAIPWKRKQIAE